MENVPVMYSETKTYGIWARDEYTCTDPATVYSRLAGALIAKKLNKCTYVTRIKRVNNYDGTQTITVNYCNDCRSIFVVPDHI